MNTKTMRLPPRRVLTPSGTSNKRKERDDPFDRPKPIPAPPVNKLPKPDKPIPVVSSDPKPSNQLLAGYLAHEFLTKGTLLGQPWAPPKGKPSSTSTEEDAAEEPEPTTTTTTTTTTAVIPCRKATTEERERYAEVTGLLKGGGTHFPGFVNPTQLARFLHLL